MSVELLPHPLPLVADNQNAPNIAKYLWEAGAQNYILLSTTAQQQLVKFLSCLLKNNLI